MASDTRGFTHASTTSTSFFQKTVCLQNWWLFKAEKDSQGRTLAVAGFTSREQQAVRLFSSAPILKRHDVFTLETVDGICVMIKGFIDKARTEENGFPSEVFDHFVFGFPPYWEEYAEKCLGKESTTEHLASTDRGPVKASIQSETIAHAEESSQRSPSNSKATSEKPHGKGRKKNLGEKSTPNMDRMEKSGLKSGERKSSVVILPHHTEVSVGCPGSSSHGLDNSSVPYIVDRGSKMSRTCLDNTSMEHLTPKRLEGDTIIPSTADMNVNITQGDAQLKENHTLKSLTDPSVKCPILTHHMSKTRDPNSMSKATQNQGNVRSSRYLAKQLSNGSILQIDSLDSSHCSGRVQRSSSRLKGLKKDDQVSATILEKEKGLWVSVSMGGSDKEEHAIASVDSMSVDRSLLDLLDAGNQSLRTEMTLPDTRPSTCTLEQKSRCSYKSKNSKQDLHGEIMTSSNVQKDTNKAKSASRNRASDKTKEKIAIGNEESGLEKTHASGREAKRKLANKTSVRWKANEQVPTASPESVTCKRSRSGRLLLPALEFWRNQRAVYDADRKITGVTAGYLELPSRGSRSEPPRKKMQHK